MTQSEVDYKSASFRPIRPAIQKVINPTVMPPIISIIAHLRMHYTLYFSCAQCHWAAITPITASTTRGRSTQFLHHRSSQHNLLRSLGLTALRCSAVLLYAHWFPVAAHICSITDLAVLCKYISVTQGTPPITINTMRSRPGPYLCDALRSR